MIRYKHLLLLVFLISTLVVKGQDDKFKTWKVLAKIDYSKATDEYGEFYVPEFSEEIRALEGKEITLPGYIIPFEGMFQPNQIIVSSLPVASCFFCGTGGPETVAQAHLTEDVRYTAKLVSVTGTLELNDTDTDQLMYILKDAKVNTD